MDFLVHAKNDSVKFDSVLRIAYLVSSFGAKNDNMEFCSLLRIIA